MSSDFYTERRALADKVVESPKPIGWRREGTYPLVNAATGGDPFDSAPSRNPYPPTMPTPDVKGGPLDIDIHVKALRHVEHVAHDAGILVLGETSTGRPSFGRRSFAGRLSARNSGRESSS